MAKRITSLLRTATVRSFRVPSGTLATLTDHPAACHSPRCPEQPYFVILEPPPVHSWTPAVADQSRGVGWLTQRSKTESWRQKPGGSPAQSAAFLWFPVTEQGQDPEPTLSWPDWRSQGRSDHPARLSCCTSVLRPLVWPRAQRRPAICTHLMLMVVASRSYCGDPDASTHQTSSWQGLLSFALFFSVDFIFVSCFMFVKKIEQKLHSSHIPPPAPSFPRY